MQLLLKNSLFYPPISCHKTVFAPSLTCWENYENFWPWPTTMPLSLESRTTITLSQQKKVLLRKIRIVDNTTVFLRLFCKESLVVMIWCPYSILYKSEEMYMFFGRSLIMHQGWWAVGGVVQWPFSRQLWSQSLEPIRGKQEDSLWRYTTKTSWAKEPHWTMQ